MYNVTLPLEVGNLDGLLAILLLIMFGPAVLLLVIGFILRSKQKRKAGKVLFILAGVYMLVSFGVCGALIGGF
jgi:quinol-cytochrome oxidoreductase complex cytochrome b subunit